MASNDPAVEAAQRVEDRDPIVPALDPLGSMVDAAREALAPVRELHKRGERCRCCGGRDNDDGTPILRYECTGCTPGAPAYHHWPCATALLVYTSEELR